MAISDMSPALQRALAHKQRMAIAWRPYAKPTPAPVALAPHPAPASIPLAETRSSAVVLDDAALAEWADGLTTRVGLQAELTWVGLNDGYVDAGGNDVAIPYLGLYWILGPVIKQHCFQCPEIANGSPYDPPGKGGHTIDQSPGDGGTVCGAGCKCWLEYGLPLVSVPKNYAWSNNVFPGPGKATAEIGAQQLQRQAASYSWQETMLLNPESEYLSDAQKGALDLFRAKWFAWEDVRGTLPQAPDMFAGADAAQSLQDLDTFWETLTAQQSNILIDLQEAIGVWNDATAEANGLLDASLDDGADLGGDGGDDAEQLAEAGADEAIQLFSFGRAFGGAGAAGRGAHGIGSAFDSLHPRGFHGKFRFVNGGHHAGEGGQREHAGNAEHAGGQRGASKEERSPNAHANRRVLRGKVNDSARTSRLARMAKRTGSVEKSPNEGAARRSGAVKSEGGAKAGKSKLTEDERMTAKYHKNVEKAQARVNAAKSALAESVRQQGEMAGPGTQGRYRGNIDAIGHELAAAQKGLERASAQPKTTAEREAQAHAKEQAAQAKVQHAADRAAKTAAKPPKKIMTLEEHTAAVERAGKHLDVAEKAYHEAHKNEKEIDPYNEQGTARVAQTRKAYYKAVTARDAAMRAATPEARAAEYARAEAAQRSPAEHQAQAKAKTAKPQKTAEEKLVAQRATQLARAKSQNQAGYSEHLRSTSYGGMTAYRMPKAEWFGPGGPHAMQVRAAQLNLANARTLAKGDTAWKGEEHPPFSKSEFLRATLKPMNSRQQGQNPGFTTKIGETTYHIKLVQRDTALASETVSRFIKGSENAAYQAHAEQAATEIGHLLGVGEHMVDAHSFQVGNNHFVATKFQTGVKPLGDPEKGATPAKEAALFKTIGEGGAARLMLHEYLTGNGDAHAGNILTSAKTGEVKIIDFGRAFTQPGALMQGMKSDTRPVSTSWFHSAAKSLGIKVGVRGLRRNAVEDQVYKSMRFPQEAVQHALSQEPHVINILKQHGLGAAVKTTQARFNVLRQLGNDTSLAHFDEIQMQAFRNENGAHLGGAVDFSERNHDEAIQLFSIGGALRGLLGGGRSAGGGHGGMLSGGRSVLRKGNGEYDGSTRGEQKSKPASTRGHKGEAENAGHGGKGKPAKVEEKSPNEGAVRRVQARRPAIERTASGHVVEHVAQRVQERATAREAARANEPRVARQTARVNKAQARFDQASAHAKDLAATTREKLRIANEAQQAHGVGARQTTKAHNEYAQAEKQLRAAQNEHQKAGLALGRELGRRNDAIGRLPANKRPDTLRAAQPTHNLAKSLPHIGGARQPAPEPTGRIDENGQHMPFTRAEFAHALAGQHTLVREGNLNDVFPATIAGREYFVKTVTRAGENATNTFQMQATREPAGVHLARILGMREAAPAAVYNLYHDGKFYTLSRKAEGTPVGNLDHADRQLFERAMQGLQGQKLMMYEYLMGQMDRHPGNILFDKATGVAKEIDFNFEFGRGVTLSWNQETTQTGRVRNGSAVNKAITGGGHLRIAMNRAAIAKMAGREELAVSALKRLGMSKREVTGVSRRFGVLRQLAQMEHPTIEDWNKIANKTARDLLIRGQ